MLRAQCGPPALDCETLVPVFIGPAWTIVVYGQRLHCMALSLSNAAYHLERGNVALTDPTDHTQRALVDDQRK